MLEDMIAVVLKSVARLDDWHPLTPNGLIEPLRDLLDTVPGPHDDVQQP